MKEVSEKLRKIDGIEIDPLDSHTIKIVLKKKSDELEERVNSTIRSSKGYVEIGARHGQRSELLGKIRRGRIPASSTRRFTVRIF